jgi:hypothetical protein
MTCYRVNFFNNLPNSNGQEFKCLQRSLLIRDATDEVAAAELAKREFEQSECISNWSCHAHLVEVEPLSMEPYCVGNVSHKPSAVEDYESEPGKLAKGEHTPVILFSLGVAKRGQK